LAKVEAWKEKLFAQHPPVLQRKQSRYGATIKPMRVGDFYRQLIGSADVPKSLSEWMRIPPENLNLATNGRVFVDNGGAFGSIRAQLLGYYPEDLRLKRLSAKCMLMAQTGQYNYLRMAQRGDWTTANLTQARFVEHALQFAFLLNRKYPPYYKWTYRAMCELPLLGTSCGPLIGELMKIAATDMEQAQKAQDLMETIVRLMGDEAVRQNLAKSNPSFMAILGEDIRAIIGNDSLRAMPAQYEV